MRVGDQWTFVAIDPKTKLIPTYLVGKRSKPNAIAFMTDLSNRPLVQTWTTGRQLNFTKLSQTDRAVTARRRVSYALSARRSLASLMPTFRTSIIERQNLTMRMSMRRFTRLTNAFSKKIENHRAAVGLHFAHYNFVRLHKTLRTTPAMAAGVSARRTLHKREVVRM